MNDTSCARFATLGGGFSKTLLLTSTSLEQSMEEAMLTIEKYSNDKSWKSLTPQVGELGQKWMVKDVGDKEHT